MTRSLEIRVARQRFLASRGQPLTILQSSPQIAQTSSSVTTIATNSFGSRKYQGFDKASGKYIAFNEATESEELVDLIIDGETGGYPVGSDILVSQGTATFS